jgi:hypothetical protein
VFIKKAGRYMELLPLKYNRITEFAMPVLNLLKLLKTEYNIDHKKALLNGSAFANI